MQYIYLTLAVMVGIVFAIQPGINGVAAKTLGSPMAATALSVFITLLTSLIILTFTSGFPSPTSFAALPWWVIFGGMIGTAVVAAGATFVPIMGAAIFFVCLIGGQLIGSVVLDHFGAFGTEVRQISWTRLLGIALAFGGALLVRFG